MMKAAKFTEAQNKDTAAEDFDSVGSIVAFCEKEGGGIPEYQIVEDKDIIDTIIRDNHEYLDNLINNDANISQQIEQFLKKQEIMLQHKQDRERAKEQGLDPDSISSATVEDYADFHDQLDAEKAEDEFLYINVDDDEEE